MAGPETTGYEVRLGARLDPRWADRFHPLRLTVEGDGTADGTTVLRGPVTDQAALHGVLGTIRDLGLPLLSVARLDPEPAPRAEGNQP